MGLLIKYLYWRFFRHIIIYVPISLINLFAIISSYLRVILGGNKCKITASELKSSGLATDTEVTKIVRRTFDGQLRAWLKIAFVSKINTDNVHRYLEIEGEHYLVEALANERGVILLNPHFGPFLFALPALGYRGYFVNQVAVQGDPVSGKREGLEKLIYEAQFEAIENNMPVNFINVANNPMVMKDVLKALKSNQCVLFAATGREGRSWQQTRFLGREATFNIVPFKAAAKTKAALLPIFVLHTKSFAKVVIDKPIDGIYANNPEQLLKNYFKLLEKYVLHYPEHFGYFLYDMHKKSRTKIIPLFSDYPE